MRLFLVVCSVLVGLMSASGAFGATTKTVSVTANGFSPKVAGITADDSIVWKNTDSKNHQIVSTRGSFASPVIAPGKTYTFTFGVAGTYDYRDALHPKLTGTIRVAGLPPALDPRSQRSPDHLRQRRHAVRPGQQQEGRRASDACRRRPTGSRLPSCSRP